VAAEPQNRARRPQQGGCRHQKHPWQHERALELLAPSQQAPRDPRQLVCQRLAERMRHDRLPRHHRSGAGEVKGYSASRE